ncbi:rRNA methylase [Elusimicrobium minutum Pei191]|uniref:rRNA methylase n=1 Tax=Elusimicrobium minutum (strain Pei191) TaxID=445932 RepID=B2KBE6_ELUMP|nr:23S rRNA (guanosine(2251)-2'-O)-methyltransferase RlmB [Elusimicrobium minutum]ACC97968.1 rRNA methylase [Elusimicrobium minutum Pei191]
MADNLDIVFGVHAVTEVIKNRKRRVIQLYVLDNKAGHRGIEDAIKAAKRNNIKIDRMDVKTMDALTKKGNHQGIAARVEPVKIMRLIDAIDVSRGNKKDLWIAVDEMTDPQNLGSIIRSAACLGFSTIILPSRRTVGLTPSVYKVASGATEKVTVVEVANLATALLDLKDEGFWIYGADMGGQSIVKTDYSFPAVLVVGSEGTGIREKTAEHCDQVVSIPQAPGSVDSLNAANAASIIMFDMFAKANLK